MSADDPKSIWAHLEEFRSRLILSLTAIGAVCSAAFVYTEEIFRWLRWPLDVARARTGIGVLQIATSPVEVYVVAFKASLAVGVGGALPVLLYEIYRFVDPALKRRERRAVYPFFAIGSVLFYAGAALGYRYLLPWMFSVLLESQRQFAIEAYWTVDSLFSIELWMILACGLAFEIPLLMALLGRFGILEPGFFRGKMRIVIFLAAAFSAWITPTGDPFTMLATLAILLGFLGVGWFCLWASADRRK